jgi:hypothetical protein
MENKIPSHSILFNDSNDGIHKVVLLLSIEESEMEEHDFWQELVSVRDQNAFYLHFLKS